MNSTRKGDPREAAAAAGRALAADRTPLRPRPDGDAVSAVRDHAETLLAGLARWEVVATDTRLAA
jgi:hypothetical protein